MSAYINRFQENVAGTGAKPWIPLNRWATPDYSIQIEVIGTATYSLEGTLAQINRGEDADQFVINDAAGTPISGISASQVLVVTDTPLEAIRINQTAGAGSVNIRVMQQGS